MAKRFSRRARMLLLASGDRLAPAAPHAVVLPQLEITREVGPARAAGAPWC